MSRACRHKRHVTCSSSATELSVRQVWTLGPIYATIILAMRLIGSPPRSALGVILVSEKYTYSPQKTNYAKEFDWPTLN